KMSRETVTRSRWPCSMRVKRARCVFSQSCSVFLRVVSFRLRIISLMLSFNEATSPDASTVMERVRSPFVTAVATSAIARTWVVSPGAAGALHLRLPAELAVGADLACDARNLGGEGIQLVDQRIDRRLELQHLAFHVDRDLLRKIALRDRGGDFRDVAHLSGEV